MAERDRRHPVRRRRRAAAAGALLVLCLVGVGVVIGTRASPEQRAAHLRAVAAAQLVAGRLDSAAQLAEEAVALFPDRSDGLTLLGRVRAAQRRSADAERLYERAIAADATDPTPRILLAYWHVGRGDFVAAIPHADAAARAPAAPAEAFQLAAHVHLHEGHWEPALALLEKRVQRFPEDAGGYLDLARVRSFLSWSTWDRAEEEATATLAAEARRRARPSATTPHLALATALAALGHDQSAVEALGDVPPVGDEPLLAWSRLIALVASPDDDHAEAQLRGLASADGSGGVGQDDVSDADGDSDASRATHAAQLVRFLLRGGRIREATLLVGAALRTSPDAPQLLAAAEEGTDALRQAVAPGPTLADALRRPRSTLISGDIDLIRAARAGGGTPLADRAWLGTVGPEFVAQREQGDAVDDGLHVAVRTRIERLLGADAQDPFALTWSATVAWLDGKPQLASPALDAAIATATFPEARRVRALLYLARGHSPQALADASEVWSEAPTRQGNTLLLCLAQIAAGRPGDAATLARDEFARTEADPQIARALDSALGAAGVPSDDPERRLARVAIDLVTGDALQATVDLERLPKVPVDPALVAAIRRRAYLTLAAHYGHQRGANGNAADLRFAEAESLRRAERADQAAAIFVGLVVEAGARPTLRSAALTKLSKMGRTQDATRAVDLVLCAGNGSAGLRLLRARLALDAGDSADAASRATALLHDVLADRDVAADGAVAASTPARRDPTADAAVAGAAELLLLCSATTYAQLETVERWASGAPGEHAHVTRGYLALRRGSAAEALATADALLGRSGPAPRALLLQSMALADLGELEQADRALDSLGALDSASNAFQTLRGRVSLALAFEALRARDSTGAQQHLVRAICGGTEDDAAAVLLAAGSVSSGDESDIEALIEQVRRRAQDSLAAALMRAYADLHAGRSAAAQTSSRAAATQAPGSPIAAQLCVIAAIGQGDLRTARAVLGEFSAQLSMLDRDYLAGCIAALDGDDAAAIRQLRAAHAADPSDVECAARLLGAAVRARDVATVVDLISAAPRAAATASALPRAHVARALRTLVKDPSGSAASEHARDAVSAAAPAARDLGAAHVLLAVGAPERARDRFATALEADPHGTTACEPYLRACADVGDANAAEPVLTTVLERAPDNAPAAFCLGLLAQLRGDVDRAAVLFRRALQSDPGHAFAANNLAWMLAENDEALEEALALARGARARAPEHPSIAHTEAAVLHRLGREAEALEALDVTLVAQPEDASAQLLLARVLDGLDRWQDARKTYERVARLDHELATRNGVAERLAELKTLAEGR